MPYIDLLQNLRQRMVGELSQNILPFWIKHTVDHENGGFYGALTNDLQVRNEVERSLVLCARILWTYSAAYRWAQDPAYLQMAEHAYAYLTGPFLDREYGGMYWWLDRQGRPVNDRKQTYGQAFAIYGLAEYFRASGRQEALDLAKSLFALLEQYALETEYGGYIEGCSRDWQTLADMRLSEKEPYNCPKSMNSMLHIIEGYTSLLRSWADPRLVSGQRRLLDNFLTHIIDPKTHCCRLFFDNDWQSLSNHISYGHDIETSWLLVQAGEVLNDPEILKWCQQSALDMADAVFRRGLEADGSLLYEGSPNGLVNAEKHWWVQAEGVVGFVKASHLCAQYDEARAEKYLRAAVRLWEYIEAHMVDRQDGEWFKVLDRSGNPNPTQVKTGPWECPYHHARACLEVIQDSF